MKRLLALVGAFMAATPGATQSPATQPSAYGTPITIGKALEIIDRAVEFAMLPPAPAEKACAYCDFLSVCGPNQERRARRKSRKEIADLIELRGKQ